MQTLFSILADSLVIWSRNFTLMYILLFLMLLVSVIVPESETPTWEIRWVLLFSVLFLLWSAFMAGWFNMIGHACVRYLQRDKNEPLDLSSALEAFRLFREFLPGVSRFFLPVFTGSLIQVAVLFNLFMFLEPYWKQNESVFIQLTKPDINPQALLQTLSPAQMETLTQFWLLFLASIVVYGIFYLLTMLWPAFVVFHEINVLKAYWRSIKQFFKDPMRLLGIYLMFLLLQTLVALGASGSPLLLNLVFMVLNLLLDIYMAIVLFVYVHQVAGTPTLITLEDTAASPESDNSQEPPPA